MIQQALAHPARAPLSALALAVVALTASSAAWGFGFGPVADSVAFGRPLDLSVPVRLDAHDSAAPGCLAAQVQIGERQLPAASVRVDFVPADAAGGVARLRVHGPQTVDEPVMTVQLRAGCATRVDRRFVVLADPQALPPQPAPAAATAASPRDDAAPSTPAVAAVAVPEPPRARPAVTARASRARRAAPAAAPVAKKADAGDTRRAVTPRLKLDEPEWSPPAAATAAANEALRSANEAAVAAAQAASAAAGRVASLQEQVQALQRDAASRQASLEAVRSRLTEVQQGRSTLPLLMALCGLLGAALAWLGGRFRGVARRSGPALEAPAPVAVEPVTSAARPAEAQPVTVPSVLHAAAVIAAPSAEAVAALLQERPATVEDLLDLEQQAEFFIMLGQDDAAVELLLAHLRDSGGASALPYLKLLEIHQRRGDHEAYERVRARFNRRFNAYAPRWDAELDKGRSLLDYQEVSAALQAAWPTPAKAMAQLQALLYRKGEGELFELPAYRDLLVLYALARDLASQGEAGAADVDVLLPAEAEAPRLTQAMISSFGAFDTGIVDERPPARVDLDLSTAPARGQGAAVTLLERA